MFTLSYLTLLAALLLIALFAASEAVLAATNRLRLRYLLRSQSDDSSLGNPSTSTSDELSNDTQKFIATVTIAANIPLLAAAVITMSLAVRKYGPGWEAGALALAVALSTITFFQVTPRLLVSQPGALKSLWWVRPAQLLVAILRAPVGLLMWIGSTLLRPSGLLKSTRRTHSGNEGSGHHESEEEGETRDLVEDLVESAQASGIIEERGKELIESIFSFGDTRVSEVMIPRPDILALNLDSTPDAVLQAFQESGFSRLPVQEGDIDRIAGILHVGDVLRFLNANQDGFSSGAFSIAAMMRAPMFIPESQKIDEAFTAMRGARTHLSIIMDEFGGTAGLMTVEDILEELVGEIADEHDRKVDEPLVILDEKTAIVDALLHIDDLNEDWKLSLPSGEFDTVGGFVIEHLGRAPLIGDRVELPIATLVVHALRGSRPHRIMIHKKEITND